MFRFLIPAVLFLSGCTFTTVVTDVTQSPQGIVVEKCQLIDMVLVGHIAHGNCTETTLETETPSDQKEGRN